MRIADPPRIRPVVSRPLAIVAAGGLHRSHRTPGGTWMTTPVLPPFVMNAERHSRWAWDVGGADRNPGAMFTVTR